MIVINNKYGTGNHVGALLASWGYDEVGELCDCPLVCSLRQRSIDEASAICPDCSKFFQPGHPYSLWGFCPDIIQNGRDMRSWIVSWSDLVIDINKSNWLHEKLKLHDKMVKEGSPWEYWNRFVPSTSK